MALSMQSCQGSVAPSMVVQSATQQRPIIYIYIYICICICVCYAVRGNGGDLGDLQQCMHGRAIIEKESWREEASETHLGGI